MASELRVNSSTNRSGLGTITYTDSGPIVSGVGTFANGLTVDGTQTTVKSLKLTGDSYNVNWFKTTHKLRFNDNAKATFGTADDLSIYHDGNHNYIEDTGTGNLFIKSDSVISIRGTTVAIKSADNSQTLIKGVENSGSELYFNNNLKFQTTNTGVSITGTTTSSGSITVTSGNITASDGGVLINGAGGAILYLNDSNDNPDYQVQNIGGAFAIKDGTNNVERLVIASDGKATFAADVQIDGDELFIADSIKHVGDTDTLISFPSNDTIKFNTAGSERLRITSAGRVGIGTDNPAEEFHLYGNTAVVALVESVGANDSRVRIKAPSNRISYLEFADDDADAGEIRYDHTNNYMGFHVNNNQERVRITSAGHTLFSGVTSNVDTRNVAGITVKSPGGISLKSFGANGSRNWRIRPDDLNGWADLDFSCAPTDGASDWPDAAADIVLALEGDTKDVIVKNGNLKIGVAGKGIDFSVTGGPASGTGGSELLDDYEEGTFSPGWFDDGGNFVSSYSVRYGQYTKIGNVVYFCFGLRISSFSRTPNSSQACRVGNLPFVSREVGDDQECVFNLYARLWGSGTPPETAWIRQSSGSGSNHVEFYMDESQTGNDHRLQGEDFSTSDTCRVVVNGFYYVS